MIVTLGSLSVVMKKYTRYTGEHNTFIVAYDVYNNGTQFNVPDKLYIDCSAYRVYDASGKALKFKGKKAKMVQIASLLANHTKQGESISDYVKTELVKILGA